MHWGNRGFWAVVKVIQWSEASGSGTWWACTAGAAFIWAFLSHCLFASVCVVEVPSQMMTAPGKRWRTRYLLERARTEACLSLMAASGDRVVWTTVAGLFREECKHLWFWQFFSPLLVLTFFISVAHQHHRYCCSCSYKWIQRHSLWMLKGPGWSLFWN